MLFIFGHDDAYDDDCGFVDGAGDNYGKGLGPYNDYDEEGSPLIFGVSIVWKRANPVTSWKYFPLSRIVGLLFSYISTYNTRPPLFNTFHLRR